MSRRRQRGEGALFQRASDGLWVGKIDLGYSNGRRKRKTVYGKTQADAVKRLRDARKAVEQGNRSTANPTVASWLRVWLEEVCPGKPKMKPRTLANYRNYVQNYIEPAIGRVRLDRLSPKHVRELHKYVAGRGLSSTTVGHAHRILGTALNDAMREGLIAQNPVSLVPQPANAPSTRAAIALDDVRTIFHGLEGDRLASRWHTAFLLGLRQGECLGLRWSAVNLENGVIYVVNQLQRIPYRHGCKPACGLGAAQCPARELATMPGFEYERLDGNLCLQRPKTYRSIRTIPLPAPLVSSLINRRWAYEHERDSYVVDHDLVWSRPDGRPIDSTQDQKQWHAILEAAGLPRVKQHAARHTTATLLMKMDVPEHVIMAILGHSDVVTTRGYEHVDITQQRRAIAELGSALFDA